MSMRTPTDSDIDRATHQAVIAVAYNGERDRLVADLRALSTQQWNAESLCASWAVRDVAAHLLMPYELGVPGFVGRMIAARFDFDRLADRWAHSDRRRSDQIVDAVAATTAVGFAVPGAGTAAPLCHLFVHAHDIRGALGLTSSSDPAAARIVLDELTDGKHPVEAGLLADLQFVAGDADWRSGAGPVVKGPAIVLASALSGRIAAAAVLHGPGADQFRSRLTP